MLLDLKTKKLMDCPDRIRILTGDLNRSATFRLFETIRNLILQLLHYRHPRRRLFMYEHRRFEIYVREHPGDMAQVHLNLLPAFGIADSVCGYFDGTAICEQPEMMRGLGVIEAHHVITALIHLFS